MRFFARTTETGGRSSFPFTSPPILTQLPLACPVICTSEIVSVARK